MSVNIDKSKRNVYQYFHFQINIVFHCTLFTFDFLKFSSICLPNLLCVPHLLSCFVLLKKSISFLIRDFRPGAKNEYTVQVQVRFCLLETTCEQADTFPSQIQLRVNNKPATLPVSFLHLDTCCFHV